MKPIVGVIGLGIMGSAMATALIEAGFSVVGTDVRAAARARLKRAGGRALASSAAVADAAAVMITSLPSVAALDAVVVEIAASRKRKRRAIMIETSTLPIADKERAKQSLARAGLALLDCPISGTARRLKELNPHVRCVSLQPDSSFHGIEGTKHMATAIVPRIYDAALADADLGVSTERAYEMVKRLAREEGVLAGISAGGALAGCLEVAKTAPRGSVIVTVFPDSGDKYLSEKFWEEG